MLSNRNDKRSVDDVEAGLLPEGAPVSPSTTFSDKAGTGVDLSHHFSELAKARVNSPLKDLFKYATVPGTIMMAGGLPHPDYFPYDSISAEALTFDAYPVDPSSSSAGPPGMLDWFWHLFGTSSTVPTKTMVIPKYDKDPLAIQLSTTLQYSTAAGHPTLQKFVTEFSRAVFKPANPATGTFLHAGNTDAWTKVLATFCNPGELVLMEEWAYTSALAASRPYGIKPVGVAMDGQGMRADSLEEILANWDEKARGAARPHVMYTVPVGQNPSGTTMGADRKKAIYNICCKYDVIIIEDDPYYFLQVGEYQDAKYRSEQPDDEQVFLDSLVPSYVRFDHQGRVVRLDTFSKVIAPGSRMGFYTANPIFLERLERATETSAQSPSGFTQTMVAGLLTKQWGYSGYIRWLRGIRAQYTVRRDTMMDALRAAFDVDEEYAAEGAVRVFVGRSKRHEALRRRGGDEKKGKILFSVVTPTAGMFLWLKVHLYNHPHFDPHASQPKTPAETLEFRVWEDLALGGVLFAPGWLFGTDPDESLSDSLVAEHTYRPMDETYRTMSEGGKYGHLRLSYSNPSQKDLEGGFCRFANVLDKHFFTTK